MAWVLPEILRSVNNVALASEVIDSVRDALSIDILLGTRPKVLRILEAEGALDARLEHLSRLLA